MIEMTFPEWCTELDRFVSEHGFHSTSSLTQGTGTECWEGYYEDGLTPQEAWIEDLSYAW